MSRFIRKNSAIGLVLLAIGLLAAALTAWAAWVSIDIGTPGNPGLAGSMTGTPPGVGPMSLGSVVEVEVEGVGCLRNAIVPSPYPSGRTEWRKSQ